MFAPRTLSVKLVHSLDHGLIPLFFCGYLQTYCVIEHFPKTPHDLNVKLSVVDAQELDGFVSKYVRYWNEDPLVVHFVLVPYPADSVKLEQIKKGFSIIIVACLQRFFQLLLPISGKTLLLLMQLEGLRKLTVLLELFVPTQHVLASNELVGHIQLVFL